MSLTVELRCVGWWNIGLNFSFVFLHLEQQRQEILIILYCNWSLFAELIKCGRAMFIVTGLLGESPSFIARVEIS
jgi:hypothetical protein